MLCTFLSLFKLEYANANVSLAFLTRSNAYFFFWPAQKNDRDLNKSIQRLFKLASFARHLPSFLIMLLFYWNCIYRVEVSNCRNRNITGSSLGRRDFFASIRKREVNLSTRSNTICHESVCFLTPWPSVCFIDRYSDLITLSDWKSLLLNMLTRTENL